MCFSASGSFIASGLLATIGVAALRSTTSTPHRMFAATPLLFSAQQAAEGVVWLTLGKAESVSTHQLAVNAFLAFALVVWPVWMPSSLHQIETDRVRRRWLLGLVCVGIIVSACAASLLLEWQPLARVAGRSLCYDYPISPATHASQFYLAIYAIPAMMPFFVSSAKLARVTGVALVISLIATVIIERDALTSVWCFFAALLSGLILTAVILEERRGIPPVFAGPAIGPTP